jgi:hypothetical protein
MIGAGCLEQAQQAWCSRAPGQLKTGPQCSKMGHSTPPASYSNLNFIAYANHHGSLPLSAAGRLPAGREPAAAGCPLSGALRPRRATAGCHCQAGQWRRCAGGPVARGGGDHTARARRRAAAAGAAWDCVAPLPSNHGAHEAADGPAARRRLLLGGPARHLWSPAAWARELAAAPSSLAPSSRPVVRQEVHNPRGGARAVR